MVPWITDSRQWSGAGWVPVSDSRRLTARLDAQLLSRPATSVTQVVERVYAVQAQDPRGFRLAVRSRSTGLRASDVDAALNERRCVVSTLNRGTLHLVLAEDFWDLHLLTTPQLAVGNVRRLREEGVEARQAARGVQVVAAAVAQRPCTRAELRRLLDSAGVPTGGQAFAHLLMATTLEGLAIRGPMVGAEHAFVAPDGWIGPCPDVDREAALARLARRYLAGHGPGAAADLARWAGLPLGQARLGFEAIADETEPFDAETVVLCSSNPAGTLPRPRLLGAFDPVLLGWVSRDDVVGPHVGLVTNNGLFRPFAMVKGRAVATWSMPRGRVALEPLEPIPAGATKALDADAREVERFLAVPDD
jgi:hypothetical protein